MERELAFTVLYIPRNATNVTEADLKLALNNILFSLANDRTYFSDSDISAIAQEKEAYQVLVSPAEKQPQDRQGKLMPGVGFFYRNEIPKDFTYETSDSEIIKERPDAFKEWGLAQGASKEDIEKTFKALFQNIDANDPKALEKLNTLWKNYALITGRGLSVGISDEANWRAFIKVEKDMDRYDLEPTVEDVD